MNALTVGNKGEIIQSLREYKTASGHANYPALFSIPSDFRLPEMAKKDFSQALSIVVAGVTLAIESMNLVRNLNNNQIVDLAETILDTSNEDNLSLEDLMLFLQKLTRGEYGKLYESMDIPKFMEFFEEYREERFQAMRTIREEQSVQYKATPINDRIIDFDGGTEQSKNRGALIDYLKSKP